MRSFHTKTPRHRLLSANACTLLLAAVVGCSDGPELVEEDGIGGDATSDAGAGGSGGAASGEGGGGVTHVADLSVCDATRDADHGTLCAIQPSKTDPAIRDFDGSAEAPGLGFGYHVVGVPDAATPKGIWVHFGGSFGSPYKPSSDDYATHVWLDELLGQGYLVIQVAYSNAKSIAQHICGPASPGLHVDNCSGDARQEVLEGVDVSTEVDVPLHDGVEHRIDSLLAYLVAGGWTLPELAAGVDWPRWRVSGHSQGAGHAYYLARRTGVRFACHLGGPYDYPDTVEPPTKPIADWYLEGESATPPDQLGAFVVTSDEGYGAFVAAYGVMGMEADLHWFEATGDFTNEVGEPVDGHAASLAAPELAPLRAMACFR